MILIFWELFTNLNIRMILNALTTMATVEMLIPMLIMFITNPISVSMTIDKSNLFQEPWKYELSCPISLTIASKLNIAANP